MHTFKINVLIQFLASSTYFRTPCVHHQEEHLYMQFCMVCFSYIYVSSLAGGRISSTSLYLLDCLQKCMKNIPYKTACTNVLPDDEHMVFENM